MLHHHDEFLETIDNINSRDSTVQYRLDDGEPVRQTWTLSDDNTALFYPGSCAPFIAKLRTAKQLAFEYRPAGRTESTLTFPIEELPDVFTAAAPARPRRAPQDGEDPSLPLCANHDWKLPCRS